MNILLTDYCNRSCSFCFAKQRVTPSGKIRKGTSMTVKNYNRILSFLEKSQVGDVRLLGGEPTLHPKFIDYVETALKRGFKVHIFTNGIMPRKVVDYLSSVDSHSISILVNISPPDQYNDNQWERIQKALGIIGSPLGLGITVASPDFEYAFLLPLIDKFGLHKRIRVGIAQSIVGTDNQYLPLKMYRATGRAIVNMAETCEKKDILIGFDCGLTQCMFTEKELGKLGKLSEGFMVRCGPIIDVGTDLSIWSCFPLSNVFNTHLDHFQCYRDIVKAYERALAPYRSLGSRSECINCKFLKRNQCKGGCLSHTLNALQRKPPRVLSLAE